MKMYLNIFLYTILIVLFLILVDKIVTNENENNIMREGFTASGRTIGKANMRHSDDKTEDEEEKDNIIRKIKTSKEEEGVISTAKTTYNIADQLAEVIIKVPFIVASSTVESIKNFFGDISSKITDSMEVRDSVLDSLMGGLGNIFTIMQTIGKQGATIIVKMPESGLGMIVSVQEQVIEYMAKFL
jgi:hypothetical protein